MSGGETKEKKPKQTRDTSGRLVFTAEHRRLRNPLAARFTAGLKLQLQLRLCPVRLTPGVPENPAGQNVLEERHSCRVPAESFQRVHKRRCAAQQLAAVPEICGGGSAEGRSNIRSGRSST